MKQIFPVTLGLPQFSHPTFKTFTSAICSFAILIMPFAQIAVASRLRSELRYQSSKIKDVGSTNRAAKNSETGNFLEPVPQIGAPNISATLTDNPPEHF